MKNVPLGQQLVSIIKTKVVESGLADQLNQEALSQILQNEGFIHIMKQLPSIVGIFNFNKRCYDYFNAAVKHEWGYDPSELTGETNVDFTMDICVAEHGPIFVNQFVADVMDIILQHKNPIDIMYTICVQVKKKNGDISWYFMETNILALNESGFPAYSIFNAVNIDSIKKDPYVYYSVREKKPNDFDKLILTKTVPAIKNDCILSARELELLRFIQQGLSSEEIAQKLSLSTHTIQSHRKNILTKTNSENTADVLSLAMLRGWI